MKNSDPITVRQFFGISGSGHVGVFPRLPARVPLLQSLE
jgi:hypothetical protein